MFNSVYPALEELKQPLSSDQLRILKNQLDSENPQTSQTKFNYAWGLIKSNNHKYQQNGIAILIELHKLEPTMQREILYYLSLGSFKLGDYSNAKRYIETLIKREPDNLQAKHLLNEINDKITQDGLMGLGITAGAIAVGIGIVTAFMTKKRK
ncbi:unnamed protein product [Candida verbasci]|uniref:Mitochondrial fission 1 protein n=1 Tax=Candida verbasci TaxID=1227364 RepID=A0A9W4XF60_9ASCO|nr:unnamed protein product [Candida verbasci]